MVVGDCPRRCARPATLTLSHQHVQPSTTSHEAVHVMTCTFYMLCVRAWCSCSEFAVCAQCLLLRHVLCGVCPRNTSTLRLPTTLTHTPCTFSHYFPLLPIPPSPSQLLFREIFLPILFVLILTGVRLAFQPTDYPALDASPPLPLDALPVPITKKLGFAPSTNATQTLIGRLTSALELNASLVVPFDSGDAFTNAYLLEPSAWWAGIVFTGVPDAPPADQNWAYQIRINVRRVFQLFVRALARVLATSKPPLPSSHPPLRLPCIQLG